MAIKHFAVGCAAILTAAAPWPATSNFTVNGQTITKAQQEELIRVYTSRGQERTPQLETQVRHLLTRDALLLQEARKAKISERDDVQRMIDNATKNILMSTVINDWLAKNPVKEEEVKALFEKEQKRWGKTEVSVATSSLKTKRAPRIFWPASGKAETLTASLAKTPRTRHKPRHGRPDRLDLAQYVRQGIRR